MTCIAGLIDKGKVYMGGDSAGLSGLNLTIRADSKVFKNDSFIFGFTSSFRMGQILRYKFKPPYHKPEIKTEEYINTDFIDAVRQCLKENGYSKVENNEEIGGTFLAGYRGKLYRVDSDYQVGVSLDNFAACGSGEAYALATLYNTAHLEPKERILRALKTAEYFSAGVRGPFIILSE